MKYFELLLSITLLLHAQALVITRRHVESEINAENEIMPTEIKTSKESLKLPQKYIIEPMPTEAEVTADDIEDFAYDKVDFETTAEERETEMQSSKGHLGGPVKVQVNTENVSMVPALQSKTANNDSPLAIPKEFLRPTVSAVNIQLAMQEPQVISSNIISKSNNVETLTNSYSDSQINNNAESASNSGTDEEYAKEVSIQDLLSDDNIKKATEFTKSAKDGIKSVVNIEKNLEEEDQMATESTKIVKEEIKYVGNTKEDPVTENQIATEYITTAKEEVKSVILRTAEDLEKTKQIAKVSTKTVEEKKESKPVVSTTAKLAEKVQIATGSIKTVKEENKPVMSTAEDFGKGSTKIVEKKDEVKSVVNTMENLEEEDEIATESLKADKEVKSIITTSENLEKTDQTDKVSTKIVEENEETKSVVSTMENLEEEDQVATESTKIVEEVKSAVSSEDVINGSVESSELFIANVPPKRTNLNKVSIQNSKNSSVIETIPPSLIVVASTEKPTTTTNAPPTSRPFRPWFANLLRPGQNSLLNRRNTTTANQTQSIFGMGLLLVPENLPNFLRPWNFTRFPIQQQQQSSPNVDLTRHITYNISGWNGTNSIHRKPLFKPYFFNNTYASTNATTFKRKPWNFMKSGYNYTAGDVLSFFLPMKQLQQQQQQIPQQREESEEQINIRFPERLSGISDLMAPLNAHEAERSMVELASQKADNKKSAVILQVEISNSLYQMLKSAINNLTT